MKYLNLIICLFLISFISCDIFSPEEFRDINYFTPKILPDGHTIVLLKNIHKYSEKGTPGGTNTDEIYSKWFLIKYDFNTGSLTESNISGFNFSPFWLDKGITCATDSLISITNSFNTYILNISNSELIILPEELDIHDVNIDLINQNLYLLEGFISYYIKSFNKNTNSISELFTLDKYYGNMAASWHANQDMFILWNNFSNNQEVVIVDIANDTLKTYSEDIKFANIYDYSKVAFLNSQNQINLCTFNVDTLIYQDLIELNAVNVKDFSINQSADKILYHALDVDHGGYINFKELQSQSERTLFTCQHKKL
jgi:hypothetical protein